MLNRLEQVTFTAEPFGAGRFNLHVFPAVPRRIVAVFVHGLSGDGYGTWRSVPKLLFSRDTQNPVDIGIYDYPSGFRRFTASAAAFEFWRKHLREHVNDLASRYEHIFLIGHSMGGKLIEAVAMDHLRSRALQHRRGAGPLAALVVVASPRAGSGWAGPLKILFPDESRILRRLGAASYEIDTFYSTYVDRYNIAQGAAGRTVLPVFSVSGGIDAFVSPFSANVGIPESQRKHFHAGHSPIAKAPELASWLDSVMRTRLEVIEQAGRESGHAGDRTSADPSQSPGGPVSRFVTDSSGLAREEAYRAVRQAPGAAVPNPRNRPMMSNPLESRRILVIATGWRSRFKGLDKFNRNLCEALAASGATVYCVVIDSSESDRAAAAARGVTLIQTVRPPGTSVQQALSGRPSLPADLVPDLIIGHGRITGGPAAVIAQDHLRGMPRRLHIVN
ncbi:hypothetical protein Vau01_064400 [Virgisporangium aurantiacum]|uniref:AB hydrolase-1 domain-containing protein n=1 Tax=Virgisporangium aurantiacum TaxID=175570 RepID=A0A8J3Z7J4_9ACTN|nr:hypothetical protein Vau01_064400 [Virgisporangium aurantiacum]